MIVGDDSVMVIDAQATPLMAREVIRRIRRVTSKPVRQVVLSHYHAVRRLYASARRGVAARKSLKQVFEAAKRRMDPVYGAYPIYEHCMPFDVSRAYDEARGIKHPRIWTAKRDRELWKSIG